MSSALMALVKDLSSLRDDYSFQARMLSRVALMAESIEGMGSSAMRKASGCLPWTFSGMAELEEMSGVDLIEEKGMAALSQDAVEFIISGESLIEAAFMAKGTSWAGSLSEWSAKWMSMAEEIDISGVIQAENNDDMAIGRKI